MNKVVIQAALGAALALAPCFAQLNTGDIVVSGFSNAQAGMILNSGSPVTLNLGSFGGTSTSQAILWDPRRPDSFMIGGTNWIGRVIVAGSSIASYELLTTNVGQVGEMDWDQNGQLIVGDTTTDQVNSYDPITGAMTPLTSGVQPWGTSLNAMSIDPLTQDIVVGANLGLFRVPAGGGAATTIASGWSGAASFVSGIAFDPATNEVVATLLSVSRVVRVDSVGTLTDVAPAATITSPNSIDVDQNGDWIVGAANRTIYRVPYAGGPALLLGTAGGTGSSASGVSVVKIPFFALSVTDLTGGSGSLGLVNVPFGTIEGYTVLSFDTSLPAGTGPAFGIIVDATVLSILTLAPVASPGNPLHWTVPVSSPLYPADPFTLPPGFFPLGVPMDFLAVCTDGPNVYATPVIRRRFG